jgi:hypothetical protein
MPPDQQNNQQYNQYGVFWLYNWFHVDVTSSNNMNIFFLMNGNIFNYSLASEKYSWDGKSAYAIPPNPPGKVFCSITGECGLLFVQSYINAYNTAFNQPSSINYQRALYRYQQFTSDNINNDFVNGTFGYAEEYKNIEEKFRVKYLSNSINNYAGIPYLFISAGSGSGPGFMYLNWIIATYGVPYVIGVS